MFSIAIDWLILDYIQTNWRNGLLDNIMLLVSKLGNHGAVWIALTLALLLCARTRRLGITLALSLLLEAVCCNLILKPLVARVRPCVLNPDVWLLLPQPADFSFPSGHTGAAFAVAAALVFSRNKWGVMACLLALLMGFSRLYLYVHYPTDVLGGMVLGIISAWLSCRLTGRQKSELVK